MFNEVQFCEINGSSAVSNEQTWVGAYPINEVINTGLGATERFEALKTPAGLVLEYESNCPTGNEILQYSELSISLDY